MQVCRCVLMCVRVVWKVTISLVGGKGKSGKAKEERGRRVGLHFPPLPFFLLI